jgi:DNA-directed RNA polymerase specialized sigma24 family protein
MGSRPVDDEPFYELAWEYIELKHDMLRRVIARASGGRRDVEDEMFNDVCTLAVPRALRTYDSSKASLDTHVRTAVKCYALKWWASRRRYYALHRPEGAGERVYVVDLDGVAGVVERLESLTPYDRGLVVLKHLMGLTFEEMAEVLEVGKSTARLHYEAAMAKLRNAAEWAPVYVVITQALRECARANGHDGLPGMRRGHPDTEPRPPAGHSVQ